MLIVEVGRMVWSMDLQQTYVKPLKIWIASELTQTRGRPTDRDSVGGNLANIQSRSGRQMLLQVSIRSQKSCGLHSQAFH